MFQKEFAERLDRSPEDGRKKQPFESPQIHSNSLKFTQILSFSLDFAAFVSLAASPTLAR